VRLVRLTRRSRSNFPSGVTFRPTEHGLGGLEFELAIRDRLLSLGWQVEKTPVTGDFGADLVARFVCMPSRFTKVFRAICNTRGAVILHRGFQDEAPSADWLPERTFSTSTPKL
jgi:hypothetical protein